MSSKRIYAMVVRHLYVWPRSLERLTWNFGWPLLDLAIWGLTMDYLQKTSQTNFSLINLVLGAIILWTIVQRAQNEVSANFLDEAYNRNIINIFSTPLTRFEFLMAMIILNCIKLFFTLVSMTLGAYIFYKFNIISTFGLFIPFLFFNLLVIGWSIGFFVIGLILRFGYSVAELAWAIAILVQPFSCVFYPLSALPYWAQKIALSLPTVYIFEEMRRIIFSGKVIWNNLLISFGLNILYLLLALWFFNYMFEKAREHGRLIKLN